jgi:hypothetical protein
MPGGNDKPASQIQRSSGQRQNGPYGRYRNKVKPAGDEVDARMRTADDYHHAIGRVDGKRQVTQFKRTRSIGDQCEQVDTGSDLCALVDELKVGTGSGRSRLVVTNRTNLNIPSGSKEGARLGYFANRMVETTVSFAGGLGEPLGVHTLERGRPRTASPSGRCDV